MAICTQSSVNHVIDNTLLLERDPSADPIDFHFVKIWIGLSAVFLLVYSRLGFTERGHLFEYSVLAIFIHKALMERAFQGRKIPIPALLAFLITFAIGALDEFIQVFIPSRVFDIIDILFNGFATFVAIVASSTIQWVRKMISKD